VNRSEERDEAVHRRRWQQQLLPFMTAALILGALVFTAMSVFELRDFYDRVQQSPFELGQVFSEVTQI
jgi:hypothetical protein